MQYQADKFINAVAFFTKNTNPKVLGVTKLMKLLFFADFLHYERYGRPIIGDKYFRLPEGPVPTESYDLWKKTFERMEETGLEEYVRLSKEEVRGGHKFFRIEALKNYNENLFSESDLEVMKEVAGKFYDFTGSALAEETHSIPFVKDASRVLPIDYLNAIDDEEDKKLLAELQHEEEEVESSLPR